VTATAFWQLIQRVTRHNSNCAVHAPAANLLLQQQTYRATVMAIIAHEQVSPLKAAGASSKPSTFFKGGAVWRQSSTPRKSLGTVEPPREATQCTLPADHIGAGLVSHLTCYCNACCGNCCGLLLVFATGAVCTLADGFAISICSIMWGRASSQIRYSVRTCSSPMQ
jgi:hypothetical protein